VNEILNCSLIDESFPQIKHQVLKSDNTMKYVIQIEDYLTSDQKFCDECEDDLDQTFCSNCQTFFCKFHTAGHTKRKKHLIIN
jgi:hypothetical protein